MTEPDRSKEKRALESAKEVFTRYGYARTTMADIALKAHMSRPALYLLFANKEAIFDCVIREIDRHKMAEINTLIGAIDGLQEKLTAACISWGLHPVELAAAHPDAADLFDLRFPAVRQAYTHFEACITALITSGVERSSFKGSPGELARTLVFGMRGLRDAALDTKDLRRMIEVQVEVIVRAIR